MLRIGKRVRAAAIGLGCLAVAGCGGSGGGQTGGVGAGATLADRFDAALAAEERVAFRATAEGPTRLSRLPRGGATYAGHAGFITVANERALDRLLDRLETEDLQPEDVRWIARATLEADFERFTVEGRFDDFIGQRNEVVDGSLRMERTFIERAPDNSAVFVGNVSGDLRDGRGPVNVVGIGTGEFVGTRAQALEGEILGSAQRPGRSPQVLIGAFVGER